MCCGSFSACDLVASWQLLVPGCDGISASGKMYDACGVCGGNNMTCAGCDDLPNSGNTSDICGVCGGDNSSCIGCIIGEQPYDACGVCDGDNSTCLGCDGVPASGAVVDLCGACGGDNSSCISHLCNCSADGVSAGIETFTAGCNNHFGDAEYWCYVNGGEACVSATPSQVLPFFSLNSL